MLTQMELFSGIFIASTNLIDGLDQASLRRFDLKVKFDYLGAEQAWGLFKRQCEALAISEPAINQKQRLDELINITPGDFAAAARRHRFQPLKSSEELMSVLSKECQLKDSTPKCSIGFHWT